jgi:eukaryotic-like serine/threonine-protein kinase
MSVWDVGREVGPYVLIDRLGAGGMGEVWKARDTRLGRMVALKRLLTPSDAFEREARTIAALNHPHICTLHDIGADYLVMEHIDGVPLRGPLDPDEGVRLALQIAAALDAAHGKGIVHRDLKPTNVLVTDGRAKLLDFGIAKLRRAVVADDATMTLNGGIAGTPAYMSPEQAQGRETDARSDIFSFGAVFYEMLSGRRAFEAPTAAETMSAVLRDDPPAAAIPDALSRIITRCLEKSPTRRFQSVAELRAALEQVSKSGPSTPRAASPPSIAVLPFANLSSDPEQEYFSDGLTEEIINLLARVDGLKVIARTSAFSFKGRSLPIGDIAEALGVTSVLEGSVRRAGNRIRVTAQLVNAVDGSHRWSERYDRDLADVFAVQDDIASAIVSELRGRLAGPSAPPRAHTPTVPAYEAFLMARHLVWTKHSPGAYEEAQELYQTAIALDPGYALPYAALAELFHIRASMRGPRAREVATMIRPAAERALALDPSLPEAHMWLGVLSSTYEYDWAIAEHHFARATTSPSVAPELRHMNGYFHLRFRGRADDAVAEHRRALQDDPLNLIIRVGLVLSLYSAGRPVDAAEEGKRVLALAPGFAASYTLQVLNVLTQPPAEALAFAQRFHAQVPGAAGSVGLLAGLLRRDGNDSAAAALMRDVSDLNEYGNAVDHALYQLVGGDTDRAFEAMAMLVEQHHPLLIMVLVGGPYGALLRSSPRWPEFARRIGLSPSH